MIETGGPSAFILPPSYLLMMPLRRFTIHQPKTAAEAAQMLAEFGEKGRAYAGGTELLLAMKHDLLRYEHLVDVKTIAGLDKIEIKNGALALGSASTHRAIESSALVKQNLPVLADMEAHVANVRVRASGTLGGNLCFAEPHSDPASLLMALGAKVHVQGKTAARTLAIDKLITGAYETSLAHDEIMIGVEVPVPAKSQRFAYLKFQLKERPTLGLALVLDVDGENIKQASAVVGSVSAVPTRSDKADGLLAGSRTEVEKQLSDAAEALAQSADPVDDLEGSAEYKRHLIGVFLRRAFIRALA
jgi:carbon-monoxide dehydrogenase medium subunit